MQLDLNNITKEVGGEQHLYPLDLTLAPNQLTVLLGATQAGKTSLMRIMAGLDTPTSGRVQVDGVDVTGVPVRNRNIAMVYQQFINYPSMTVFDNIASPLKLARHGLSREEIAAKVNELANRLHLSPFLDRLPTALSGGQQQRVALARALAKEAPLMLLDEPLANLDYKLREELREDLTRLFSSGESTVVYATTEPGEALLLGGYTAVMDAGKLLQYGPTVEVFHRPQSLRVARAFSDPPMNTIAAQRSGDLVVLPGSLSLRLPLPDTSGTALTLGMRASALRVEARPGDLTIPAHIELAEISGSDTYLHTHTPIGNLVAQLTGVHEFAYGADISLHLSPAQVYVFDGAGDLLVAPRRPGERSA